MTKFVEARHAGVEGTALLPESFFKWNPGWVPVGDEDVPTLADGNVDAVLAAVGDDPVKAAAALEAERASSKPRKTIVGRLSEIKDQE